MKTKGLKRILAVGLSVVCLSATAFAKNTDIPKYYVDEDFYVYAGGLPAGFTPLTEDAFTDDQLEALNVGDSSMKIQNGNGHIFKYDFDNPIKSGKYYVEFNIKGNSNWFVGFVPEAALMGDNFVKESDYTEGMTAEQANAKNKEFRKQGVVLGGDGASTYLFNGTAAADNLTGGTSVASGTDTHNYKMVLNLDSNTISVSVDDGEEKSVKLADNSGLAQRTVVRNITTTYKDMIHGIGALSFGTADGGEFEISNLSVKRLESYNAYQDFNDITLGVKNGWYFRDNNATSGSLEKYMTQVQGKNTNDENDKALEFNFPANANNAEFLLNTPIKAGTPFVIEYDILTEEDPSTTFNGNAWNLGLLNETDTQIRGINSHVNRKSNTQTGEEGTQSNYAYTYTTSDILVANGNTKSNPDPTKTHMEANGKLTMVQYHDFSSSNTAKLAEGITYKPGEWNNIRVEITPTDSNYTMKVTITHADGTKETSTNTMSHLNYSGEQKLKLSDADIYGLNFGVNNSWTRGKFTLDNLKVYDLGEETAQKMTAKIDKELYPRENAVIKLHFSEELANTGVVNKNNITIVREADESVITDYEIEKVTDRNYKIIVNQELLSGKHLINFGGSISGKYSGSDVSNKVSFKTEYKKDENNTVYPEVNSIKVYDFKGNLVDTDSNDPVTSRIDCIEVTFNTVVDEETAKQYTKLYEDGSVYNCSYSFNTTEDAYGDTVSVLTIDNLGLLPSSDYVLKVDKGIASSYDRKVLMEFGDSIDFSTQKETAAVTIVKNYYDETKGEYNFKITKSNKTTGKLVFAVARKKLVTKDGKQYDSLQELKYYPIDLESAFRGTVDILSQIQKNEGEEITAYLWSYPDMQKINIESLGDINLK